MADTEERPSKIRKIGRSDSVATRDASPIAQVSEATADGQEKEKEKPQISKSQLKKLRKREQWEAGKESRKAFRREKHKEKKARKAEERAAQEERAGAEGDGASSEILRQKQSHRRPVQTPIGLILDCDFDHLMTEKEIVSLGAQLTRCYSDNRTSPYRAHMVVNSWGGQLRSRFETVLANTQLGWKGVTFTEKDFVEAAADLHAVMKGTDGSKLVGAFARNGGTVVESEHTGAASSVSTVSEQSQIRKQPACPSRSEAVEDPATPQDQLKSADTEVPYSSAQIREGPNAEITEKVSASPSSETASKIKKLPKEPERLPTEEELNMTAPSIVYLTADSPNTIDRLSPYTSYIIGGIVDKNRHKGLCYKRACERSIPTAKLPIGEYMTMQSRTVLTVNHVMEIMLKWLETGDWGEAFLRVIPKRKEARLKAKADEGHEQKPGDADHLGTGEKNREADDDGDTYEENEDLKSPGHEKYQDTVE